MNKTEIKIEGMTCDHCERHVFKTLDSLGAEDINVSFRKGIALFHRPDSLNHEKIKEALDKTPYKAVDVLDVNTTASKLVSSSVKEYDFVVIGSGGAAFSAAIQASENGSRVAMVEKGTIGGTCVNIGCVPSKMLIRAGELNSHAHHNPFKGLALQSTKPDISQLKEQKDELVQKLRKEKYEELIEDYGFDLIKGEARFKNAHTIVVNNQELTSRHFLIATGASPAVPDIPGLKESDYLTSTSALNLTEVPKHLVVIGSGYIALELGQMLHDLGSEVTLMQRSDRLLKDYDPEISQAIEKSLTEKGIRLIKNVEYNKVVQNGSEKEVHIRVNGKDQVVSADQLLVAVGRAPNTTAIQLQEAGVKVGKAGEVLVNDFLETSVPHIYAAGDVTLSPQFVYVAAYQGNLVAKNVTGAQKRKQDLTTVPAVTFTSPSVASVGLTEQQAREQGYNVKNSVLPLEAVPRALVNHETTGVFKLVMNEDNQQIIGAHVVAENAGDVIYAATLAVKFKLTAEDLQETMAPYLTMAEGLKLASLTFDKDVSKLSCCAG
ncbi:mercury(II) reductase (plasmid) [Alkalihalobacillus hwajinpoensis]|uniref:mercury(II) reductase n=1 Tax=Guptibacillus hwajinpoensis TaxID=208199 RepID=UPI0018836450|nr:mercury(II) reductase [Pseudalkalibacillus hwajinpoensis]MBF0706555.1 mercury(II) reductase [Pseudalkalibacillus hwajinpoensis]